MFSSFLIRFSRNLHGFLAELFIGMTYYSIVRRVKLIFVLLIAIAFGATLYLILMRLCIVGMGHLEILFQH